MHKSFLRERLFQSCIQAACFLLAATCLSPTLVVGQETAVVVSTEDGSGPDVSRGEAVASESDFKLVPMPLRASFLATTFGRDPDRMKKTTVYRSAEIFGIDVPDDLNDVVIHRQRGSNHFYLFHNTLQTATPCEYFVQRIHKRVTNYTDMNEEPEVSDHYMIEAIKSSGGQLKKPDQHYASHSLKKYARRVIEKTLEIGEIANEDDPAKAAPWPYDQDKLSEVVQEYGSERAQFDDVMFKRSIKWTIRVELDDQGSYSLQVPRLGINLSKQTPVMTNGAQILDQSAENIEIVPGRGLNIVRLGSSEQQATDLLGPALRIDTTDSTRTLTYEPGVRLGFFRDRLASITVLGDFPGASGDGIKLGDSREKVAEIYQDALKSTEETDLFDGIAFQYKDDAIIAMTAVKFRAKPKAETNGESEENATEVSEN